MSELQFPKNPIVGQQYDFPPYKYYWDGIKWKTMGIGHNPVNDLRNELEPKVNSNIASVFEALRRSYAEAGLNLVDGSFEEGGVLTSSNDVLLHKASGKAYSGTVGSVAAGTDPTAVGSGYIPRTDVVLRNELGGDGGSAMVNGSSMPLASIADLRASHARYAGDLRTLIGYRSSSVSGAGQFVWDATSVLPDDGGAIIAVTEVS